ncbi:MAG: hypothetical protein Q8Q18_02180 [bacterium]|nr:hypothetical protein [bacterium]
MNRRTLIIGLATALIVASLAIGVWLVFRNSSSSGGTSRTGEGQSTSPFPFGDLIDRFAGRDETDIEKLDIVTNNTISRIIEKPVAGYVLLQRGNEDVLRYIEQQTGNVYEYTQTGGIARLTNTTLPRIQRAQWMPSGTGLLLEYERPDNKSTVLVRARLVKNTNTETSPANKSTDFALDGEILPASVIDFTVSTHEDRYALLRETEGGVSLSVHDFGKDSGNIIFTHPHKNWLISWDTEESITISSKPSARYAGISYLVDVRDGSIERIGSEKGIMTTISENGSFVASTIAVNGSSEIRLTERGGNLDNGVIKLTTNIDKCSFNSGSLYCAVPKNGSIGDYPESWLRGLILTDDHLYRVDLSALTFDRIYDTTTDPLFVDMYNLSVGTHTRNVYFRDKYDNTLWVLER